MDDQGLTRCANAKINLALHVVGQRADGYHLLDSLVCFVEYGDQLKVSFNNDQTDATNLTISGNFSNNLGADDSNLVMKAARLLQHTLSEHGISRRPVTMILEKNLPIASGIGGGSADAAAALQLLKEQWARNQNVDLVELAMHIGADVPMCLNRQPKRVQGIGEILTPFELNISLPILLVNSGSPVPTPEIFGLLKNKSQPPITSQDLRPLNTFDDVIDFLEPLRNDLQEAAITHCPDIKQVLNEISSLDGCALSRMSGSGGTCFGLFEDVKTANAAKLILKQHHPDWWCCSTRTIPYSEEHHEH